MSPFCLPSNSQSKCRIPFILAAHTAYCVTVFSFVIFRYFLAVARIEFFNFELQITMATSEDDFLAICAPDNSNNEVQQHLAEPNSLSFDMWNSCTVRNFRSKMGQNKAFKPLCIYVLKQVTEYLSKMDIPYLVCGGTALSVYRENGKMICHDGDVDVAIFETDFLKVMQNMPSFLSTQDGNINLSDKCPVTGTSWFDKQGNEIPFNGVGGKRLKFFATKKLWDEFGIRHDIRFDPALAHLDVFTFGQHPDNPNCFCYNWNIPGSYDFRRKLFPKICVLPLKTYNFEGVSVQGPNDLKTFLEVEYGYLGRDAMFDFSSQLYVKIPQSVYEGLPKNVKKVVSRDLP